MNLPNLKSGAPGNYVGLQFDELAIRSYLLADNFIDSSGKGGRLSDRYYYRVVFHETAHALGMNSHPFPATQDSQTNLSEVIVDESVQVMYKMDVEYLSTMLCKS